MKDVMLDLETLGTRYSAQIISIGAVYFDRETGGIGDGFFKNIDGSQFRDEFTTDYDTIKWWFEQSDAARQFAMKDAIGLIPALQELNEFLLKRGNIQLWSHATFDIPILMNAFEVAGIKCVVPFRNMRDLRTLMDLSKHHSETPREGTHHHALNDATYQVQYAVEAIQKLHGEG